VIFTELDKIDKEKYYFDSGAADGAVQFIETFCRHTTGKWALKFNRDGTPRDNRLILSDWQKDKIIRPLFGWKVTATGFRKFTTLYLEVAKKNGKSALAAAIENYFIYIDSRHEAGSEIYAACPSSKGQAIQLLMDPAREMIDSDPTLSNKKLIRIYGTEKNTKSILNLKTGAIFKPLTREGLKAEGIKPQAGFIDELHVFKDDGVIENLEKSMIIRDQPLICYTTTAGDDLTGIGYEKSQYYEKVARGQIVDESALVCIYRADKEDDPFAESTWRKANPMWDISINQDQFKKEVAKARHSAASLNHFMRYHLNLWINTLTGWISDLQWSKNQTKITWEDLEGCDAYGGLDLSSTRDTTAFCLVIRKDGVYYSLNKFYLPEEKTTEDVSSRRAYPQWVSDGFITETPGNVVDYDLIRNDVRELGKIYNIKAIYYDPYNSAHIIPKMVDEDGFECIKHRQGAVSMNTPMKHMDVLVTKGIFQHDNNPVLRWMMGNVKVQTDEGGNIKIAQKDKHKDKIDGVVSNVMACSGWVEEPEDKGTYLTDSDLMFV
jgi:phage terminase large subunit-like protein